MFPYQRLDVVSIVLMIIIVMLTVFAGYEKWMNRPEQEETQA